MACSLAGAIGKMAAGREKSKNGRFPNLLPHVLNKLCLHSNPKIVLCLTLARVGLQPAMRRTPSALTYAVTGSGSAICDRAHVQHLEADGAGVRHQAIGGGGGGHRPPRRPRPEELPSIDKRARMPKRSHDDGAYKRILAALPSDASPPPPASMP